MLNTLSVTTTPPIKQTDTDTDHRDDGDRGVAQRVTQQHHAVPQTPLAAGGSDVIFVQNLEHAGAGDARDQGDIDHAEGHAG